MLVKRNESYNLRRGENLVLETSCDLDVKVNLDGDADIKGFTYIIDFNWIEAEIRLQEVLERKRERVFFISNIYKVYEFDEEDEFVSEYIDTNLLEKIECMTLEQIIDKYWDVRVIENRPTVKSIDNSYIVLICDDWDNDLVLYIDAIMGFRYTTDYAYAPSFYYLVHEDN